MSKRKVAKREILRGESSVTVGERGHASRSFTVRVAGERKPAVVHVDAPPYDSLLERRCDYAIKVFEDDPKKAFFFVELKGGDVKTAAEQLVYTAKNAQVCTELRDCKSFAKHYACIVASNCHELKPSITTNPQVWQRKIEREGGFEKLAILTGRMIAEMSADYSVKFSK